jgi:TetR/AcrR family transcriptional regulator, regulator of biofilm formation and stress response
MAHVPTEVRRQQFIDAAVTVIAREGVDGATTRRIAEEAGAPLATLHYCFQTKENLLWAVFEQLAGLVRVDIEKASGAGASTSEIAGHLLRETVRWGVRHQDHNRAQLEIWLWAERNDNALAVRLYDTFIESCKELLRGASDPLPAKQLETTLRVIVAIIDGLGMQLITHGDEKTIMRETSTAIAMLDAYLGR